MFVSLTGFSHTRTYLIFSGHIPSRSPAFFPLPIEKVTFGAWKSLIDPSLPSYPMLNMCSLVWKLLQTLGKEHSKASKAKIPHVDDKTLLPLVSKHSKHLPSGDSLGKIRDMVSVPHTCAIHRLVAHSVFGRSYAFPGG